jgi:hypothetical protein
MTMVMQSRATMNNEDDEENNNKGSNANEKGKILK